METGLDQFLKKGYRRFQKQRLGILCHQASLDSTLRHVRDRVANPKLGLKVACLIGPQHGVRGEKQDNMIESDDFIDPLLKIPVYSLYGKTRQPTSKLISEIDTFVVDLVDIGTRVYTFIYTLANCMRAAKANGKKVVVLDRPNPIGGVAVEGNALEEGFTSFVGQFPIVMRHGMTIGEIAQLFNEHFNIGCQLEVIPVKGWQRAKYLDHYGDQWPNPSPNIPNLTGAITFPGMVLFEGTNVSEGRGTTRPFEWIGAPYITDSDKLADKLNAQKMPGVYFRPIYFQPTFHKGKDEVCGGVHVHVTQRNKFNAFQAGTRLLAAIHEMHPDKFAWKKPPYEYEFEKMPIDLIVGTDKFRHAIEAGKGLVAFEKASAPDVTRFKNLRKAFLLYK